MTGNSNFKYYVLINVDGKVLNVRATNGTYSFSKQAVDIDHDLKIEDIDVETNNDSTLDSDITTTVCPTAEAAYNSVAIVHVESISVSPSEHTKYLPIEPVQLSVTVLLENATNKNVIWNSSDESIAIVDENGLVTLKTVGTVVITATSEDGNKQSTSTITMIGRQDTGN